MNLKQLTCIVILYCLLGFNLHLFAEPIPTFENNILLGRDEKETEFYKTLDAHTNRFLDNHEIHGVSRNQFKKIYNVVKLRFKKLSVFKELMASYGKKVSTTIIAGEILTTVILPPILLALHMPFYAGISAGNPWGVYAGAFVFWWEKYKLGKELAKDYNLPSLDVLHALRKTILGFDKDKHVFSILYKEAQAETTKVVPIEILENLEEMDNPSGLIQISDIEKIIAKSGLKGRIFLDDIYLEKARPEVYTTKLIRYVTMSPELLSKFSAHISKITSNLPYFITEERQNLIMTNFNLKALRLKKVELSEKITEIHSFIKTKEVDAKFVINFRKTMSVHMNNLSNLEKMVQKTEYNLLNNILKKRTNIYVRTDIK